MAPLKRRLKKRATAEDNRVSTFRVELKIVWNAQKQFVDAANELQQQAGDAEAWLAESILHNSKVEEGSLVALNKPAHRQRQVTESVKTAEDALRRLFETSRRVEQFEGKAQILKPHIIETVKL